MEKARAERSPNMLAAGHAPAMNAATAFMAMAVLAACGGEDGPGKTKAPLPEEKPVTPAIRDMPSSSYDGSRREAFVRLNAARIAAGVGAVRQNAQLDAAAQAHSRYQAANALMSHYEEPGKPLFTAVTPFDRMKVHGYGNEPVTELLASVYTPANGADAVEMHLKSVYHLAGALLPHANEVGVGEDETPSPLRFVRSTLDLGTTDTRVRPFGNTWVWPVDGATAVPRSFLPSTETPNPLPDIARTSADRVGTPIMFCGAEGGYARLDIRKVGLLEDGRPLTGMVRVLHQSASTPAPQAGFDFQADPNLLGRTNGYCLFLVALTPLKSQARYTVTVQARQADVELEKSWSFTTAP